MTYSVDLTALPGWKYLSALRHVPDWSWLLILAAFVRLVNLGQESIWYDEGFTAWLAKLSFPNMLKAIQGDVHPPLWYAVEWVNVRLLGDSQLALRVPSAILGILVVLLVWRLAVLCNFERRTAFVAGLLAALLPAAVYYSQDARMYPILAFFVLWAAISAIKDQWVLFAVAATGAVYSQNLGVFYVAAIGIAVAVSKARTWRQLLRPALAGLAVVGAWSLWLPVILKQTSAVGDSFWMQPLTIGSALWPLANMTMGWRLPDVLQMHVYAASMGISVIGLIACRKWILTRQGLIVLALVIGAPALIALVSVTWRAIYLPRALLPSSLTMMLLWAYPLQHLSRPNRIAARTVVIPAMAVALLFHYFPAIGERQSLDGWKQPIESAYQRGDVVYYISLDSCILLQQSLGDIPYAIMPEVGDLSQSLSDETKEAMGFRQLNFDKLAGLGYRRAWLVASMTPLTSAKEMAELDRIRLEYHWTLIRHQNEKYVEQMIYLVDFRI